MGTHNTAGGNYYVRWLGGEIENNLRSLAEAARAGCDDGYIGRIYYVNSNGAVNFEGYADEVYEELGLEP